jgi:exopolyphosphatase/guanosine-5'-triphosphate,3'-diphosphate pyrophosphatase
MPTSSIGAVAAIDCGTNSTRLLITDEDGRSLVRLMRITRLGEGVDASRKLASEAIERTVLVLREFRTVMDQHRIIRARMVATSAVRDALNGEEFLQAASRVTGIDAELLAGDEEGSLAYAGATMDVPPAAGDDVVVDIGGGSTELVVEHAGRIQAISLDLGCVRLTERNLRHDPPSSEEVERARRVIAGELDRAQRSVGALGNLGAGSRLIGLAGTVSTLAALEQHLADYDRERIHHFVLTEEAVTRWCDLLLQETSAARSKRPGMVAGREDVIAGGALVLREVMGRFGFDQCLVSEADILDGIAASLR